MKPFKPFLLILLLLPTFSFAQTNFKKGFVVTTAGDTLQGFIDYREWSLTPGSFSFRTSMDNGTIQEFNPGNSSYLEITGMQAFVSYEGPITIGTVERDDLWYGRADTTVSISRIYLEKLQDGPIAALYGYKDHIKERFFLLEKGEDKPQELIYRRYMVATNNTKIMEQRSYVGQLLNVARHHEILTDKLQREIEAAAYKEQNLMRVVSKINGQSNDEIALTKKSKVDSRFFAGVALNRSTMDINGYSSFATVDENAPSYMPALAFGLDGFVNGNVQQLIFRLEVTLNQAKYHLQKNEASGGGSYYETSYAVTQQTASLIPQIIYNFYNKENLKLYVGGGFGWSYSNYSKNLYQRKYIYPQLNHESVYEKDNYKELLALWYTYTLRAGVVVNRKYEITAMYLAPSTITQSGLYEVTTGYLNVGINYLFGDKKNR